MVRGPAGGSGGAPLIQAITPSVYMGVYTGTWPEGLSTGGLGPWWKHCLLVFMS